MTKQDIKIPSRDGGEFDCYLACPEGNQKTPAIVLASAIHGVDPDVRALADTFASRGYIAAAPDLFWRTSAPGPLKRDDPRAAPRGQPRLERIKAGEADLMDTLVQVRKQPGFNGRAAVIGFCYGGPFAILGPKRLGFDAGISCHGTQLQDYINDLEGLEKPVCILWGDQDSVAPPPVLDAYRAVAERKRNVDLEIFPGVLHGYMMRGNPKAFDQHAYDLSLARAFDVLGQLARTGR